MVDATNSTFQQGRTNGAIDDMKATESNGYGRNILVNRRIGSLLLYTIAALGLAVLCAFLFNALEHDTEFAIAVMGSLIGGFLGALLAAALVVDIHLHRK